MKKKFKGCSMWSHFVIEGHCMFGISESDAILHDDCPRNGKMCSKCPECKFFTWSNNCLPKTALRVIERLISTELKPKKKK